MNTRLRLGLEMAIQKWLDKNVESGDWPSGWIYDNEAINMAKAAEIVFDASREGQAFAENES